MADTFAQRLKTSMEQAHINQSDLSARTGFSKAAISQYISGKNTPSSSRITAMADVLNVSPDYLKGYDVQVSNDIEPTIDTDGKITIKQAARRLCKSEQFIRVGLQRGILLFGSAVPGTGKRFNYYINPAMFNRYIHENGLQSDGQDDNIISVDRAAQLMGKSTEFIQLGLQQGKLPIGTAVKIGGSWDYYISPKLFKEFTGIDVQAGSILGHNQAY